MLVNFVLPQWIGDNHLQSAMQSCRIARTIMQEKNIEHWQCTMRPIAFQMKLDRL